MPYGSEYFIPALKFFGNVADTALNATLEVAGIPLTLNKYLDLTFKVDSPESLTTFSFIALDAVLLAVLDRYKTTKKEEHPAYVKALGALQVGLKDFSKIETAMYILDLVLKFDEVTGARGKEAIGIVTTLVALFYAGYGIYAQGQEDNQTAARSNDTTQPLLDEQGQRGDSSSLLKNTTKTNASGSMSA